MAKSLGEITTIKLFLTSPIDTKYSSINVNRINLLTGINGSGKSLLLASTYMLNTIMSSKIIAQVTNTPFDELVAAQYVMEGCLDSASVVTGTMGLNYSNSASVDMAVSEGKVISVTFNGNEDVEVPVNVTYMSAPFRTFGPMSSYLQHRKDGDSHSSEQIVQRLLSKGYKLYDVMYMEKLISRMPFTVDKEFKDRLESFDIKEDLVSIGVDLDTCEFYAEWGTGAKRPIDRWFGSGHQSLINMLLGSSL